MQSRASLAVGASLVLLGALIIVNQFVPDFWPLILLAVGLVLGVVGLAARIPGLLIPGGINLTLGGIFLWQTAQADFRSWIYVWPLVPASVGLGVLLMALQTGRNRKAIRFGWAFLLLGLAFTALGWWLNQAGLLNWTMIIGGLGVMFLLAGLITPAGGLMIPGSILTGLGLMLFWQNATGNWASWSFTWALVPGLVGLGLVLLSLFGPGRRVVRVVGYYFVFWSLLFFAIFAAFFGREVQLLRYWPVLLILLGVWLLFGGLFRRRTN